MTENFAELFEESFASKNIKSGSIIIGTVIDVNDDVVLVSAGLKSEAVIPLQQFYTNNNREVEISVGDEIEVVLDAFEDGFGETRLSREKAIRARTWIDLEEAHNNGDIVTGHVSGRVKGGFTVEIDNVRAFLPGSLVDVRPLRDTSSIEGKNHEFKVIKLDQRRNNVVVSRRAVVEDEYNEERETVLKNLHEGGTAKGIIKNLTDYGAFVDLGGVDGLLHITDMAWKRIKHPSEIVSMGDEIDVKILKYDKEKQRVSLGIKQLTQDPWLNISDRYPINSKITGQISNLADYGCFVQIEDGVEGLVHVSEMDWTNKNINPSKIIQLGEEVEVMVLEIDEDRRRISLGIKQCKVNPWVEFSKSVSKGDKVEGQIKSITDFGIFIGLEGEIDGLVHLSDISWESPDEEVLRNYSKGQEIKSIVLAIDASKERISLGIKQLDEDPLTAWLTKHPKNSIVKGTIIEVEKNNVSVSLSSGVLGTIKTSELSVEKTDDARKAFKIDDKIEAKLINVDQKNRSISLSIKAKETYEEEEALSNYQSEASAVKGATTLGELLKEKMKDN